MAAEGPRGWRFVSEVAHYLSIREDTRSGTNELDLDRIENVVKAEHGLLEINLFTKMLLFCNIFRPRVYRDFIYD